MKKFLRTVLLVAFAVCMALGVTLTACDGPAGETSVTYTVTVSCEDTAVLSGVSVALAQNGENKAQKALENGRALFELPAGSYDVVLSGVAAGYGYTPATVTADAPNVTITLTASAAQTVTYTVTASCENGELPAGITAQLLENGEIAYSKALTDGSATFEAKAGTYTALLTGVPSGYDYVSDATKTLTATEHTAAFTLKKRVDALDVTLSLNLTADKDVFGAAAEPSALTGATVELFANEDAVKADATAVSDKDGKAVFAGLKPGTYYLYVNGLAEGTVDVTAGAEIVKELPEILKGTQDAPLSWSLGTNNVPLTASVIEWLDGYKAKTQRAGDDAAYFAFSVEESGDYSFDTDSLHTYVKGSALAVPLTGSRKHVLAHLEAGTVYTFSCTAAMKDESGDGSYTVTITKGNTNEGEDPTVPWDGEGTADSPYLIETLTGEYNDILVYYSAETEDFEEVYFKYSPKEEAEYYTLTLTYPGDAVISFIGAKSPSGQMVPFVNAATAANYSADLKVAKGTDLIICVSGGNDTQSDEEKESYGTFVCSFEITEYKLPEPETGSVRKPEVLTELLGPHSVTTETAYYFSYTATESAKYFVSTDYTYGITFTVRDDNSVDSFGVPTGKKLFNLSLTAGDKAVIELERGKTYYFAVKSNLISEGAVKESFTFIIEEYVAGEPDGTQANPFPLDPVFGEHTFEAVPQAGLYYKFTLEEETEIQVTALTTRFKIVFTQSGKTLLTKQVTGAFSGTFKAQAGEVLINVTNLMTGTADVKIKLEKVGGSGPVSGGTASDPEKLDALEGSYTRTASYKEGWYMEFTAKENCIYTFVAKSGTMWVQFGTETKGAISTAGGTLSYIAEAGTKYTVVIFGGKMTAENIIFDVQKSATPDYPWDGNGSEEAPYVLTGDALLDIWVNSPTGLYFKYVASGDAELTFTPQTTKVAITLSEKNWGESGNLATNKWVYIGDPADAVRTLSLTNGETLVFSVGLQSGKNLTNHKVQFTVKGGEPEIEGSGTSEDPEILKNLNQTITRHVESYTVNYYFQFTATENQILTVTAETNCMIGGNNPFGNSAINANASVSAQIVAGTTYKFWVRPASNTAPLDMVIVFSTSDAPEIPWSGEGTQSSPYLLPSLTGNYKVFAKGSAYLYFSYTAEKNATYRITPKSVTAVTFYLTPQTILFEQSQKYNYNSSKFEYDEFYLPAGTQLTLRLYPNATAIYEFEIEEVATKYDYTVTVNSADKDVFGNPVNEAPKSGVEVSLMNGEQVVETKTTGTDGKAVFTQPAGNYTVKIGEESYDLTENAVSVTLDSGVVYGTKEHPLELKLGSNEVPLTLELLTSLGGAVYYTFTPAAMGSYKFTGSNSAAKLLNGGSLTDPVLIGNGTLTATLSLTKGTAYPITATVGAPEGGNYGYTVTVELVPGTAEATPDEGFHFNEIGYMVGTWKTADGYTMTITDTTFLLTGPDGAKCTYTLTETPDRWDVYVYSLSWNGKTYTLSANRMTGPTGGLVLYEGNTAAYTFMPSASGETEVTFPAEMQGNWTCRSILSEEEDEDASDVPALVIGEHTITWGTKTVKILQESAGSYLLEIDGMQWSLMAVPSEFGMSLGLTNITAGTTYIFANTGAQAED